MSKQTEPVIRGRVRPPEARWKEAMETLTAEHASHGVLPYHVLERVGADLGVAARSVETRYGQHLAALERATAVGLDPVGVATIAGAADFPDAHARLATQGTVWEYALLDRAIWRDVSRALVGLRVLESRRRQKLAEAGTCALCGADVALATAA